MFAKIKSMGIFGLNAFPVTVECDLSQGLPKFDVVGLPDNAVKESRDRVRSALKNCGFKFPVSRIVVNIAPADVKKEGTLYDLPVFMGLLTASKQFSCPLDDYMFIGEMALDGEIRPVKGALPMVIEAARMGFSGVFLPHENAAEGSVVQGVDIYPVKNAMDIINHFTNVKPIEPCAKDLSLMDNDAHCPVDFADVKGQYEVKRALEIAAAGGHNVIMIGPPGTGKSMLARRIPTILPSMTFDEAIETTKIHSVAGELPSGTRLIKSRPFRSPHHTVSAVGLTGGGNGIPRPGEISLAHNGVLFLDELPEFSRSAMEALRQPAEDGEVTISRAAATVRYPSSTMLVCAMNPCPCGYYGHPTRQCSCSEGASKRYLSKISGPLLDRLDIHIEVQPVEYRELSNTEKGESSADIRLRVEKAREIQRRRFSGTTSSNAKMTSAQTRKFCIMSKEAENLLAMSFDKMGLSARAYDKILRISRTIADLADSEKIELDHVAEAIQYRTLDRKYWKI